MVSAKKRARFITSSCLENNNNNSYNDDDDDDDNDDDDDDDRNKNRCQSKTKRAVHNRIPRVAEFYNLESPHPYGILPGGNQFTADCIHGSSSNKTRDFFSRLDDELCHAILSFCDGVDLARLAQTSRFLYAICHQLELWRDLVLRYVNQRHVVLEQLQPSWKDTYVRLVWNETHHHKDDGDNEEDPPKPHIPMAVPGVYSDYFYRLHSCRTFCIPRSWLEQSQQDGDADVSLCLVKSIPASEMTSHRFYQEFEQPNRPVVVRQAAGSWRATKHWKVKYLLEQTKGRSFRATSGAAPLPVQFSFHAYSQYCTEWQHLEEAPLYLFDRTALQPNSSLWKDFCSPENLPSTCPYWDRQVCPQHDLFALLGEGRRPDHTWWIAGPKRSGSVFHMDPNATHAWNAAVSGRKRWFFYPPGHPPPGVHPSADADQVALPLTVGEWIFNFWPQHVQRMKQALSSPSTIDLCPLECTAFPGDVVFVPHGWWHMVINLDEGLNMAITHNYVSQSNLENVLKFLSQKEDQISGCRDREESIKPSQLYQAFTDALKQHHPKWLEQALAVPDWTCRAWRNLLSGAEDEKKPENERVNESNSIMAKAKTNNNNDDGKGKSYDAFCFSFL